MNDAADMIADAKRHGRAALDESAGKRLLATFGISVPKSVVVADARGATEALKQLHPPYVVKLISPDILHKSDAGGVKVNLKESSEVVNAIAEMAAAPHIKSARIDGYLIEEMAPPGQENCDRRGS
jgi:acyl-CoA synthetase (NDP forming)